MNRLTLRFLLGTLAGAVPFITSAQATGDGLRGDYYDGLNFEHRMQTRRDARIDFYWHDEKPITGVPAEQFSVRWTGWLVPPVTGHYVLHLSVDDGVRLWLDGKQLLDEWRGQPLSYFDVPVDLVGGRPYRLRLDYCQYSHEARALLRWERPRQAKTPRASSWRNLWGMTEKMPTFASRFPETIPTRYLFSHLPPPPKLAVDVATVAAIARHPPMPAVPLPSLSSPPLPNKPAGKPKALTKLKLKQRTSRPATTRGQLAKAATHRAPKLATVLLKGQAVTFRALYFEQGQVVLLPAVQASLDTLAQVLGRYPTLRLEVQGHTDNQGNPIINQQLSQRRAEAVCQYLSSRGVEPSRLSPIGCGGSQPVADNNLPTERPRNRRVVLRPLP
jgi:outer membrane protein OmpA-like peptidoglycan-associated protein